MRPHSPMSDDSTIEMEDEFVVIGDETFAKWDGDQTKYVPPTPFQSAMSTAKYSWKKNLATVQSGIEAVGVAAASRLTTAVTGLTQPVTSVGADSVRDIPTLMGYEDSESDDSTSSIDGKQSKHDWQRTEEAQLEEKFSRKMKHKIDKGAQNEMDEGHTLSRQEQTGGLGHDERGPRFRLEQQQFDPLGVSHVWRQSVRQEESAEHRQRTLAEWQERDESPRK